jgi:superfamily II DNA or RNA helicase
MISRFSSRRQSLTHSFLASRLLNARSYDRIAGYFSSSLLEFMGEELDSIDGKIRIVCNSDIHPMDIKTAKAAQTAIWQSWAGSQPETLLDGPAKDQVQNRFQRLYNFLKSGKLEVRVLPDDAFGLIHGKAGVITLADGTKTSFIGSANESKSAWKLNYELVWEDNSPESVAWVQEEFDALWGSPLSIPLANVIIQDIERLAHRRVLHKIIDWVPNDEAKPDPASAFIETPVYRKEVGLWEHQKYFVKLAFEKHRGPIQKARFVLADQVGLGKTVQLAMTAELIALTGEKPILVICPKTLIWQWQDEMHNLLDMPSAVWDGRRWVTELGIEYPVFGPEGILKCPRRVGIVSRGLISRGAEASYELLKLDYDCVILDEAHHARRRNLGENRDNESPDPNNLLAFMYQLAERTRSLLLATATPVQMRPIEAWDLLDILSRGDESVLGNAYSNWRDAERALELIMRREDLPISENEHWEWMRNPLPPKSEGIDYEIIRQHLELPDSQVVVPGDYLGKLNAPDHARLKKLYPGLMIDHNPFIRNIVRRTRKQLETQTDPETNEPLIKPIQVELLGEDEQDAILLPPFVREAYSLAEDFCTLLGKRLKGSGFLKTILLRRIGSSIHAGMLTAQRMLENWESLVTAEENEDLEFEGRVNQPQDEVDVSKTLTLEERSLLERCIAALEENRESDPKLEIVLHILCDMNWLFFGCIIFSQYRETIQWLGERLTSEYPEEHIALYSGPSSSGIFLAGEWVPTSRETIKEKVMNGELRLLLGTDAASEGLNLQRLSTLINLDLPWNPTRLEQRKGRIQRIGQINDTVLIYNLRYKDSVEDRVHQLLSTRLHDIYDLFGQIPDVLEDAWVAMAVGEKEQAKRIIDTLPKEHPFEIRYTKVEKVDWESCTDVIAATEKRRILNEGWV